MSEMDIHGDLETELDTGDEAEPVDDPEVPAADAAEQATPLTEQPLDHEVVPVDEDEYR
jgi:hypothetical protein